MKNRMLVFLIFLVVIAFGVFSCGRTQTDTLNGFFGAVNSNTDISQYFDPGMANYSNVASTLAQQNFINGNFSDAPYTFSSTSATDGSEVIYLTGQTVSGSYYFEFVKAGMDTNISAIYGGTNSSGTYIID